MTAGLVPDPSIRFPDGATAPVDPHRQAPIVLTPGRKRKIGEWLLDRNGRPLSADPSYTGKLRQVLDIEMPDDIDEAKRERILRKASMLLNPHAMDVQNKPQMLSGHQVTPEPVAGDAKPRPAGQEFLRGIRAGLEGQFRESLGATMQSVAQAGDDVPGVQKFTKWLYDLGARQRTAGELGSARNAPRVGSTSDVKKAGDVPDLLSYGLGQGLASSSPALAGATLGGAAAGPPGAIVLGTLMGFSMNAGDMRTELDEVAPNLTPAQRARLSLALGVPLTGLDIITEVASALKIIGGGSAKEIKKRGVKMILKGMLGSAASEGVTEGTQDVLQGTTSAAAGKKPVKWSEMGVRVGNAAIMGALTGGVMGGVSSAIGGGRGGAPEAAQPQDPDHVERVQAVAEAVRPQNTDPTPDQIQQSEMLTKATNDRVAGQRVSLTLPTGEKVDAIIQNVFVDVGAPQEVTALVLDPANGRMVPVKYDGLAEFVAAVSARPGPRASAAPGTRWSPAGINAAADEAARAEERKGHAQARAELADAQDEARALRSQPEPRSLAAKLERRQRLEALDERIHGLVERVSSAPIEKPAPKPKVAAGSTGVGAVGGSPAPRGASAPAAKHYTSSSGEKLVIKNMATPHLLNAEAVAAPGPEKDALLAEIKRRKKEPKAPPAPKPKVQEELVLAGKASEAKPEPTSGAAPATPAPKPAPAATVDKVEDDSPEARDAILEEMRPHQSARLESIRALEKAIADGGVKKGKEAKAAEHLAVEKQAYEDSYAEIENAYGAEQARALRESIEKPVAPGPAAPAAVPEESAAEDKAPESKPGAEVSREQYNEDTRKAMKSEFVLSEDEYTSPAGVRERPMISVSKSAAAQRPGHTKGVDDFVVDFVRVPDDQRRKGKGSALYERAADEAAKRGGRLISSKDISPEAEAVWKSLVKRGLAQAAPEGGYVMDRRKADVVEDPKAWAQRIIPFKGKELALVEQNVAVHKAIEAGLTEEQKDALAERLREISKTKRGQAYTGAHDDMMKRIDRPWEVDAVKGSRLGKALTALLSGKYAVNGKPVEIKGISEPKTGAIVKGVVDGKTEYIEIGDLEALDGSPDPASLLPAGDRPPDVEVDEDGEPVEDSEPTTKIDDSVIEAARSEWVGKTVEFERDGHTVVGVVDGVDRFYDGPGNELVGLSIEPTKKTKGLPLHYSGISPDAVRQSPAPAAEPAANLFGEPSAAPEKVDRSNAVDVFDDLVRRGVEPSEAAREAGVPEGLDVEERAAEVRKKQREHFALEQEDMFGNAPMLGSEGEIGQRPTTERIVTSDSGESVTLGGYDVTYGHIDPHEIAVHPKFQAKATVGPEQTDPARIKKLLSKKGGFDPAGSETNPLKLWRDTKGELGEKDVLYVVGGHHRRHLSKYYWTREKSDWRQGRPRHDQVRYMELHVPLEQAIQIARDDNAETLGYTDTEKGRIAYDGIEKGESLESIAKAMNMRSAAEAERYADFYRVDRDVREHFFPAANETSVLSIAHGFVMGEMVRRFPKLMTKLNQEQYLRLAIQPENNWSADQMRQTILAYKRDMFDRFEQLREGATDVEVPIDRMPTGKDYTDATGHLNRVMEDEVAAITKTVRGLVDQYIPKTVERPWKKGGKRADPVGEAFQFMLDNGGGQFPPGLEAVFRDMQASYREKKALQSEVQADLGAMLQDVMHGKDFRPALDAIRKKVAAKLGSVIVAADKELGEAAKRAGGAGAGLGPLDPVFRWYARRAQEYVQQGLEQLQRRAGRAVRTLRLRDAQGNTVVKTVLDVNKIHPASESRLYRMGATSGMMGLFMTAPGDVRHQAARATILYDFLRRDFQEQLHAAYGRIMADYSIFEPRNSALFDAIEGNNPALAKKYEAELAARRALMDEVLEQVRAVYERYGMKPPRYIEGYVAHIGGQDEAARDDAVAEMYKQIFERPIPEGEEREVANRFMEHRPEDDDYQKDPFVADQAWMRAAARSIALVPFVNQMGRFAQSHYAKRGDPRVAETALQFVKSIIFPEPDPVTKKLNDGIADQLFVEVGGHVHATNLNEAADALGKSRIDLAAMAGEDQFWSIYFVDKGHGYKATNPDKVVRLGETEHGTYYGIASKKGVLRGDAKVEMHPLIERALETVAQMRAMSSKRARTEGLPAQRRKLRERVMRFKHAPLASIGAWFSRRLLKAYIGNSTASIFDNLTQIVTHVLPQYGMRAFLRGSMKYGVATTREVWRSMATYLEHHNRISPETARRMRASAPYFREELLATAVGADQAQAENIHEVMERVERGEHEIDARLNTFIFTGLGKFGAAEAAVRGFSMMVASARAEAEGATWDDVAPEIEATEAAKRKVVVDLMDMLGNGQSVPAHVYYNEYFTNFYYNQMGQTIAMTQPWFRYLFGTLSTYPSSSLVHRELRGLWGVGRVAAAAVRAAGGAALGSVRESIKREQGRIVPRVGVPEPAGRPRGGFEQWLRAGGASWLARSSAKMMWRSMLLTGGLMAASEVMHMNLLTWVPYTAVAIASLLKLFFPDNEALERNMQRAQQAVSYRLIGPYLGFTGPWSQMFAESKGRTMGETLWNYTLGPLAQLARVVILGSINRPLRGTLETWPEFFEQHDLMFMYDWAGQKTALYGLSPSEKAQAWLGVLDVDKVKEHRKSVKAAYRKSGSGGVKGIGEPLGVGAP